jgi:hypothetical protein
MGEEKEVGRLPGSAKKISLFLGVREVLFAPVVTKYFF